METNLLSSVRSAGQWLYSDITGKEWITETAAQVLTVRSNPTSETLQLFVLIQGQFKDELLHSGSKQSYKIVHDKICRPNLPLWLLNDPVWPVTSG